MEQSRPSMIDDEVDIRKYLAVVWRRRHIVAVVSVIAALAAILVSNLVPPVYHVEAVIGLSEDSAEIHATPAAAAQVIRSMSFLEAIAKDVGVSEETLRQVVKVEPVRDVRMIRVKVRHRDPRTALRIAQAVSDVFVAEASGAVYEKRKVTQALLESTSAQMAKTQHLFNLSRETLLRLQGRRTSAGSDDGFTRSFVLNAIGVSEAMHSSLLGMQAKLSSELLGLELPKVVQAPRFPEQPIPPRTALKGTLAAIVGLVAGAIGTLILENFVSVQKTAVATQVPSTLPSIESPEP